MSATEIYKTPHPGGALDEAYIGDIRGALGTIRHRDIPPRNGWWERLRTLLAILGPGLIVKRLLRCDYFTAAPVALSPLAGRVCDRISRTRRKVSLG
jgi:hypothetical protein